MPCSTLNTLHLFSSLLLIYPHLSSAFYLPGVAPTSYQVGQKVPLHVNHLSPTISEHDAQLHSVISYDYYHPAFHFCRPEGGPKDIRESLGSIIFGDRIQTSPFEISMAKNETCKMLCPEVVFDPKSSKFVNEKIWDGYNVNLLIDGLPAAQLSTDQQTEEEFYSPGFFLGTVDEDGQRILNNHYDIHIEYHRVAALGKNKQYRVVGVLVNPSSQQPSKVLEGGKKAECSANGPSVILSEEQDTTVAWTYSVIWTESPTAWATRWDKYLHVYDPSVHWYSLIYSAVFVMLLVALVSTVLLRALRKDIARYNRLNMINLDDLNDNPASVEDGIQEDSGWKLVHGDVFRCPKHPLLLSVFLGNGAQLFMMTGLTVLFALFGLLSPSNRGFLGTVILILYTFLGFIGGYVASRAYKSFGGEAWKRLIIATPLILPAIVFSVFFFLNFILWVKGASGAVPFTTMLVIVLIWFIISVPLSVAGSWIGFKQPAIEGPTKTNQIPRQIPPAVGSLRLIPSTLVTGLLPFAAIFVEFYFIMNSLWTGKIYYMFGFLFLCYGLMIMMCAMTTILLVYFLLCAEDYRWQWRSFVGAGMTGGYVFIISLIFWATRVSFGGFTGAVLYLGYSALLAFLACVLTGEFSERFCHFYSYNFGQR
ncbi:Transmembrane 9 super member 2 [Emydomyces testavorans]|uniref:Transmembrane 9 superfamily member n=1 Tax=Emydomyces testavorans TaxID=2070801 RepID=A0AAF0DND4_9EURO|nr:Transmembrane 9 super member 2 [Emydomyces testavorans]